MPEQQRFYLYCRHNKVDIRSELGLPDYSYKFVQNYFKQSLVEFGEVVVVSEVSELPKEFSAHEYLFVFAPPHEVPRSYLASAIPVFAWEYSTIPDEALGENEFWNWRDVLESSRAAIVHSSFTLEAMDKAKISVPKIALLSPLHDEFAYLASQEKPDVWTVDCEGMNWDSAGISNVSSIQLTEVTYTYVFNPVDGRKRWEEAVSSFVWTHRMNRDVVLILKLIHKDQKKVLEQVCEFIKSLGDFDCRIVVICGFLSDVEYQQLIKGTDYVINTSCGEGQCLPLIEFMSAGVPALTPCHTAMVDYVTKENSFIIDHTWSWVPWPNDPLLRYRARNYPIKWESLCDAYLVSYETRKLETEKYKLMRKNASDSLYKVCSKKVFREKLLSFIDEL